MEAASACREITFNDSNHSIIEAIAQAICIFDDSASIATIGGASGAVRDFFRFFLLNYVELETRFWMR